jgi:hypothetical protein
LGIVERRERVVLAQELGEERDGEVELAAARAPDEPRLDQRLAEDGDAAGVLGALADHHLTRTAGRVAARAPRGQVALLGVAGELAFTRTAQEVPWRGRAGESPSRGSDVGRCTHNRAFTSRVHADGAALRARVGV